MDRNIYGYREIGRDFRSAGLSPDDRDAVRYLSRRYGIPKPVAEECYRFLGWYFRSGKSRSYRANESEPLHELVLYFFDEFFVLYAKSHADLFVQLMDVFPELDERDDVNEFLSDSDYHICYVSGKGAYVVFRHWGQ